MTRTEYEPSMFELSRYAAESLKPEQKDKVIQYLQDLRDECNRQDTRFADLRFTIGYQAGYAKALEDIRNNLSKNNG